MATTATTAPAPTFTGFSISPLTPRIGAEIEGVDLGQELSDDVVAEIRRALDRKSVV